MSAVQIDTLTSNVSCSSLVKPSSPTPTPMTSQLHQQTANNQLTVAAAAAAVPTTSIAFPTSSSSTSPSSSSSSPTSHVSLSSSKSSSLSSQSSITSSNVPSPTSSLSTSPQIQKEFVDESKHNTNNNNNRQRGSAKGKHLTRSHAMRESQSPPHTPTYRGSTDVLRTSPTSNESSPSETLAECRYNNNDNNHPLAMSPILTSPTSSTHSSTSLATVVSASAQSMQTQIFATNGSINTSQLDLEFPKLSPPKSKSPRMNSSANNNNNNNNNGNNNNNSNNNISVSHSNNNNNNNGNNNNNREINESPNNMEQNKIVSTNSNNNNNNADVISIQATSNNNNNNGNTLNSSNNAFTSPLLTSHQQLQQYGAASGSSSSSSSVTVGKENIHPINNIHYNNKLSPTQASTSIQQSTNTKHNHDSMDNHYKDNCDNNVRVTDRMDRNGKKHRNNANSKVTKSRHKALGASLSVEGCGNNSSNYMSKDNSTEQNFTDHAGIDLIQFFTETLNRNIKDRSFLLKIENDLHNFICDGTKGVFSFPPTSSYNRMLIHRTAAYFGLDHTLESRECVIVHKRDSTRIPLKKFESFINPDIDLLANEEPQQKTVLKRDAQSFEECRPNMMHKYGDLRTLNKAKSLDERRQEYMVERRQYSRPHNGVGVSKSHSFGGYGGPPPPPSSQSEHHHQQHHRHHHQHQNGPLSRGDSINSTKSNSTRYFTKQDSIGSQNTPWRLSPSSSGYKTQTQSLRSESVTPSPTGYGSGDHTPEPSSVVQSPSAASCGVVWAVTDMASVPRGSVLIDPQTLQPIVNQDGTLYHYDPSNPIPKHHSTHQYYHNQNNYQQHNNNHQHNQHYHQQYQQNQQHHHQQHNNNNYNNNNNNYGAYSTLSSKNNLNNNVMVSSTATTPTVTPPQKSSSSPPNVPIANKQSHGTFEAQKLLPECQSTDLDCKLINARAINDNNVVNVEQSPSISPPTIITSNHLENVASMESASMQQQSILQETIETMRPIETMPQQIQIINDNETVVLSNSNSSSLSSISSTTTMTAPQINSPQIITQMENLHLNGNVDDDSMEHQEPVNAIVASTTEEIELNNIDDVEQQNIDINDCLHEQQPDDSISASSTPPLTITTPTVTTTNFQAIESNFTPIESLNINYVDHQPKHKNQATSPSLPIQEPCIENNNASTSTNNENVVQNFTIFLAPSNGSNTTSSTPNNTVNNNQDDVRTQSTSNAAAMPIIGYSTPTPTGPGGPVQSGSYSTMEGPMYTSSHPSGTYTYQTAADGSIYAVSPQMFYSYPPQMESDYPYLISMYDPQNSSGIGIGHRDTPTSVLTPSQSMPTSHYHTNVNNTQVHHHQQQIQQPHQFQYQQPQQQIQPQHPSLQSAQQQQHASTMVVPIALAQQSMPLPVHGSTPTGHQASPQSLALQSHMATQHTQTPTGTTIYQAPVQPTGTGPSATVLPLTPYQSPYGTAPGLYQGQILYTNDQYNSAAAAAVAAASNPGQIQQYPIAAYPTVGYQYPYTSGGSTYWGQPLTYYVPQHIPLITQLHGQNTNSILQGTQSAHQPLAITNNNNNSNTISNNANINTNNNITNGNVNIKRITPPQSQPQQQVPHQTSTVHTQNNYSNNANMNNTNANSNQQQPPPIVTNPIVSSQTQPQLQPPTVQSNNNTNNQPTYNTINTSYASSIPVPVQVPTDPHNTTTASTMYTLTSTMYSHMLPYSAPNGTNNSTPPVMSHIPPQTIPNAPQPASVISVPPQHPLPVQHVPSGQQPIATTTLPLATPPLITAQPSSNTNPMSLKQMTTTQQIVQQPQQTNTMTNQSQQTVMTTTNVGQITTITSPIVSANTNYISNNNNNNNIVATNNYNHIPKKGISHSTPTTPISTIMPQPSSNAIIPVSNNSAAHIAYQKNPPLFATPPIIPNGFIPQYGLAGIGPTHHQHHHVHPQHHHQHQQPQFYQPHANAQHQTGNNEHYNGDRRHHNRKSYNGGNYSPANNNNYNNGNRNNNNTNSHLANYPSNNQPQQNKSLKSLENTTNYGNINYSNPNRSAQTTNPNISSNINNSSTAPNVGIISAVSANVATTSTTVIKRNDTALTTSNSNTSTNSTNCTTAMTITTNTSTNNNNNNNNITNTNVNANSNHNNTTKYQSPIIVTTTVPNSINNNNNATVVVNSSIATSSIPTTMTIATAIITATPILTTTTTTTNTINSNISNNLNNNTNININHNNMHSNTYDKSRNNYTRPKPSNLDLRRSNNSSTRNTPSTNSADSNNSPNSIQSCEHFYLTARGATHIPQSSFNNYHHQHQQQQQQQQHQQQQHQQQQQQQQQHPHHPHHPHQTHPHHPHHPHTHHHHPQSVVESSLIGAYNTGPPGVFVKLGQTYFAHPTLPFANTRKPSPNDLRPSIAHLTGIYPTSTAINLMMSAPARQMGPRPSHQPHSTYNKSHHRGFR